jgi:hypothetical protein
MATRPIALWLDLNEQQLAAWHDNIASEIDFNAVQEVEVDTDIYSGTVTVDFSNIDVFEIVEPPEIGYGMYIRVHQPSPHQLDWFRAGRLWNTVSEALADKYYYSIASDPDMIRHILIRLISQP